MPTVSCATTAEITTQLNLWKVGGASELVEPGIINLSAATYSNMTFTQVMPYRVTITGAAGLTSIVGQVNFSSAATNIYVEGMTVTGLSTSGAVNFNTGSANCGARYNMIVGRTEAQILSGTLIPNSYGAQIKSGSTGAEVAENFITGHKLGVYISGGTGWNIKWNFFRYFGAVMIQCGSASAAGTIEYNFGAGFWAGATSESHLDFMFLRGSAGITVSKNVFIRATDLNSAKIVRGIVFGDGGFATTNAVADNNLIVVNNIDGIRMGEATEANGAGTITNNTVLVSTNQTNTANYTASISHNMSSITRSANAFSPQTGATSADSGGKIWEVGASYAARDYTPYLTDFDALPVLSCNLSALVPKVASQLHPSTGTIGAYELLADLLAGTHPASKNAVVADAFNLYMNTDAYFTPGGDNAPPVAVDDSGFTTPYGTDLVIAAATLLANDTDTDLDTLTITEVGGAVGGSVSLVGTTITFTPTPGFSGAASFSYAASDGLAADGATVSLTVENPLLYSNVGTPLSVTVTVG